MQNNTSRPNSTAPSIINNNIDPIVAMNEQQNQINQQQQQMQIQNFQLQQREFIFMCNVFMYVMCYYLFQVG